MKSIRTAMLKSWAIGATLILGCFSLAPVAHASQQSCSVEKLQGHYVFNGQGINLHDGVFDFDAAGQFSGKQTSLRHEVENISVASSYHAIGIPPYCALSAFGRKGVRRFTRKLRQPQAALQLDHCGHCFAVDLSLAAVALISHRSSTYGHDTLTRLQVSQELRVSGVMNPRRPHRSPQRKNAPSTQDSEEGSRRRPGAAASGVVGQSITSVGW